MSSRRANGEGNIRKRTDGRWEARFFVANGSGRRRVSVFGKTRAEVRDRLRVALHEREQGVVPTPVRETVDTFLCTWIADAAPSLRPRTADEYRRLIDNHLAPAFSRVPLARLTPQAVQHAYRNMQDSGLSPKSVQNIHSVLHRALDQAFRWRLVPRNVSEMVDPPRVPRSEMHALSPDEARAVLAAAAGDELEALFVLAISAGLRQGELLALRWPDIDLDSGSLRVVATLEQRPGHEPRIAEPKTDRSRRAVQLGSTAVEALRRHRQRYPSIGFVFVRVDGRPLSAQILNRRWDRLSARAGVPRIRFHDLRHTAATLMLARGVHPKIVSEMLGHSSVSITLDLYSHVTPTMQREAATVMDELLAFDATTKRLGSRLGSNRRQSHGFVFGDALGGTGVEPVTSSV